MSAFVRLEKDEVEFREALSSKGDWSDFFRDSISTFFLHRVGNASSALRLDPRWPSGPDFMRQRQSLSPRETNGSIFGNEKET